VATPRDAAVWTEASSRAPGSAVARRCTTGVSSCSTSVCLPGPAGRAGAAVCGCCAPGDLSAYFGISHPSYPVRGSQRLGFVATVTARRAGIEGPRGTLAATGSALEKTGPRDRVAGRERRRAPRDAAVAVIKKRPCSECREPLHVAGRCDAQYGLRHAPAPRLQTCSGS
jgi:hypothetical protein